MFFGFVCGLSQEFMLRTMVNLSLSGGESIRVIAVYQVKNNCKTAVTFAPTWYKHCNNGEENSAPLLDTGWLYKSQQHLYPPGKTYLKKRNYEKKIPFAIATKSLTSPLETFNQRAPHYPGKSYKIAGNTFEETKWRFPSPTGQFTKLSIHLTVADSMQFQWQPQSQNDFSENVRTSKILHKTEDSQDVSFYQPRKFWKHFTIYTHMGCNGSKDVDICFTSMAQGTHRAMHGARGPRDGLLMILYLGPWATKWWKVSEASNT